jgi:hypothetical protein
MVASEEDLHKSADEENDTGKKQLVAMRLVQRLCNSRSNNGDCHGDGVEAARHGECWGENCALSANV